jgi:hypothetical protein
MKNQIFREEVPSYLLFDLLDKICLKTAKYYYIDFNSYKKFVYSNDETASKGTLQEDFICKIRRFYHESKLHYLERKMTYNSFINIVRQICKKGHIPFTSKICYNKSKYNIDYYIFHDHLDVSERI